MAQKFNPLSGNFDLVLDKASEIKYDNATSGLTAIDVQDAIDENASNISGKADVDLANLTTTAINADLTFDKSSPRITTAAGALAQSLSIQPGNITSGTGPTLNLTGGTSTTGQGGFVQVAGGNATASGQAGGYASIVSGNGNAATSGITVVSTGTGSSTGGTTLGTGNASSGNSGSISLNTGTATGTRGSVSISSNGFTVNSGTTNFSGSRVSSIGSPTAYDDAATKDYTDNRATRNYVSGTFENGAVTGWSLFNTTLTAGIPTGSISAGAASLNALSVNSLSPLINTYSLQTASSGVWAAGDGFISSVYTIAKADQAKVLTFKAYYEATSGSTNLNFSGTSSNTLAVYIYDVTNSAWIQPAGVYGITQGVGVGIVTGTFQTTANSTQYRIAVLAVNASAGAATVLWDGISVGPQTVPIGAVVTDLANATVTGTWTNNTTYTAKKARIGDSVYYQVLVSLTGAPNASALSIDIPETIDTTKLAGGTNSKVSLGTARAIDTGTQSYGLYSIVYQSANRVQTYVSDSTSTYVTQPNNITNNVPFAFGNTDVVEINFTVPVVGWSSNVQMSNDTDTRIIDFAGQSNGSQALTANVTDIAVQLTFKDAAACWTGTQYRVPVAGDYPVSMAARTNSGTANILVYVNGVAYIGLTGIDTAIKSGFVLIPNLKSGDLISFRADASVTVTSGTALNIFRLSGPATIAATESVNCRYTNTSAQSISNVVSGVQVTGWTKDFDTHNMFNATTGLCTFPVNGKYRVTTNLNFANSTYSVGNVSYASVWKNGAANAYGYIWTANSTTSQPASSSVTTLLNVVAGDTCYIGVDNNRSAGATALSTVLGSCHLEIEKVGN